MIICQQNYVSFPKQNTEGFLHCTLHESKRTTMPLGTSPVPVQCRNRGHNVMMTNTEMPKKSPELSKNSYKHV